MNEGMRTSAEGINFIKRWEKFAPRLYNDAAGHCTIGYGHLVHYGPSDGRENEMPFIHGISEPQAHELLISDLSHKAESYVLAGVEVKLQQTQYDALASFCFNLGGGAFLGSTLLKLLNASQWQSAFFEFARWNHAGGKVLDGLTARREAEGHLFICGEYVEADENDDEA